MSKNIDKPSKVKIFVGYHKPHEVFISNVYQPLLTADVEWEKEPNVIKDNTLINIAEKNKHYGELSGHYWVWKNFLPKTNAKYIGFCHYRRFLDFNFHPTEIIPFKFVFAKEFSENMFEKYSEENILNAINGYDIVLPQKYPIECNIYQQFLKYHTKEDIDTALAILGSLYPEYIDAAQEFLMSDELYTCLNFIMKTELVNEYMEWMFKILFELEKRSDWSKYTEYMTIRMPAYIAERFLNIWLLHNIKKRNLKILHTTSFLLMGEGYGTAEYSNPNICMLSYSIKVQQLKQKNQLLK